MPPQHMLHWRHYVFAMYVAASVPFQIFLSLCKNTEQISMKFAGGNESLPQTD